MSSEERPPAPQKHPFWNCLSCRVVTGTALLGSAFWVYLGPRKVMRRGIPPNMWHITQISFACGLACWGFLVLIDPVGKLKK
ncbi:distal membrane-arm assembly complex protein 1 [Elgaria multicarinata webbii]|uniref:distal membrane-arm assembly complex protein 1 n=1 Tax=Elgaria multicarinata webbii TaxID=159646 RepID=UPI002FCCE3A6